MSAIALCVGGCAPHRVAGPIEVPAWRGRFDTQRVVRARVLACALADLDLRAEGERFGRLPRLELRAAFAAPDRVRLRAAWLLGTAFDLVAEGDSVRALVPARKLAVVVDGEDAPVEAPARLLLRTLAATWTAPDSAWSEAVADSGELRVSWLEQGDTLRLAIAPDGLPLRLGVRPVHGISLDIAYDRWQDAGAARCPARVRLADTRGSMRLTIELTGIEPQAAPGENWFSLVFPASVQRVSWGALGRLLRGSGDTW